MAQSITNLPVGAKVKFGRYQVETEEPQPITWVIADKNHGGYPSGAITLVTEGIIDLRAFDAKEANNTDSNRKSYGNNKYTYANLLQWLNSQAASDWYKSQHSSDAAPTNENTGNYGTGYEDRPGFLSYFTDEEYKYILRTTHVVANNTVTDGGGIYNTASKVFLLSKTEVGLGDEISGMPEGSKLALFTNDASRIAKLTAQAYKNTLSTSKPSTQDEPWHWWLRTPLASNSCIVRAVHASGASTNSNASSGNIGLRPALNLTPDISVSDTTDSEGCYIVYERKAPCVDGKDGDLGTKFGPFGVSYVVTDAPENDVATVTEAVNGATIKNYVPVLGQTNKAEITNEILANLPNGVQATLTITATDEDGSTTRTYTFTPWRYSNDKTKVSVQMGQPIKTDYAISKVIMTMQTDREVDATITVKACNNAFDDSPTWEDITAAVTSKKAATLQNNTKTAGAWGLNVQISIQKGQEAGTISIDGFALSYE